MYSSTILGHEKIVLLVKPSFFAGKSLAGKASYSTKLIASTLTAVICINVPRFWYPKISTDERMMNSIIELGVIPNISWFIYMYALCLDGLVPFIFLIIFGMFLWIKVIAIASSHTSMLVIYFFIFLQFRSYQTQRREMFPNLPEQKRPHFEGAIIIIFINAIAVGLTLASFLAFLTRDNEKLVSSFVAHVNFSTFILVVNATVKLPVYYFWGIYFAKAYHDTWRKCKMIFRK